MCVNSSISKKNKLRQIYIKPLPNVESRARMNRHFWLPHPTFFVVVVTNASNGSQYISQKLSNIQAGLKWQNFSRMHFDFNSSWWVLWTQPCLWYPVSKLVPVTLPLGIRALIFFLPHCIRIGLCDQENRADIMMCDFKN